jgi:hypothetical protein
MEEIWKPIEGTYGRYDVSNHGNVRTWAKPGVTAPRARDVPKLMSPFDNGGGYLCVTLRIDGKVKCRDINSLVLEEFVGPRPTPTHQAAHQNRDTKNNRLDNLEWATPQENASHRYIHGTANYRESKTVDGVELYRCTVCDDWLPREGFYTTKNPTSLCKMTSECRRCNNRRRTELRHRNRPTALSDVAA